MTDVEFFSFLYAKSKFRMGALWRFYHGFSVWNMMILCTVILPMLLLPQNVRTASNRGACSTDSQCGPNGYCEDGQCVCLPGWTGDECEHCEGRTRLEDSSGYIIESVGKYSTKTKCTWLIDGGRPDATIRFVLEEFGTECSWDYLYIYDGDSVYAPLVASLNGPIRHDSVDIRYEIVTTSGFAYLYFYSDAAFTIDGFNISYSIDTCPGNGCSQHGSCDYYHLNCSCDLLWLGEACDIPACPNNCSERGYCNETLQACVCQVGFKGRDCGTLTEDGLWEVREGTIETGRVSASTILIGDDLWIIGGYTYSERENITVLKYNIPLGGSQVLNTASQTGELPRPRYAHSTVHYQDQFIMYGGSYQGSGVSDEVWSLHYPTLTWSNLTTSPRQLEGHTAHAIDDVMLVIFGYNPEYGYLNMVQEYNITSGTWSVVETRGLSVRGAYGHSSVLDNWTRKIYVHGGYKLTGADHKLSDDTYVYSIDTKSWLIIRESTSPRFLHSAVLLAGQMFVFGGNTHTDGTQPTGAECYSSDFLAYNLECGIWETLELSSGLTNEVSRFGHGAFVYQGSMWIYSGYNGLLTTSALLYNPGNCSAISNSSECMDGLPGLWCAWDMISGTCLSVDSVPGLANNQSTCPISEDPVCSVESSCGSCVVLPGCGWCGGNCSNKCSDEVSSKQCSVLDCSVQSNCRSCNSQDNCSWSTGKCRERNSQEDPAQCDDDPCSLNKDCSTCLSGSSSGCMWCQSQNRCIDSNSYMTSFPYGLCLEWRTSIEGCPSVCSDYMTCDSCQADPSCGWCDGGYRNGLGECLDGGYVGPVNVDGPEAVVDYDRCPASRWYFIECPSCQCNGHSQCPQNSSECGLCQDYTEGDQCETCQIGYYGRPQNGGTCLPCSCNGQADVCHQTTGLCYCEAKGVVGSRCESCDSGAKYYGNPENGGYCYYQLLMNWQYTFNLSDGEDKNYTSIAMMTSPDSTNRDIEFDLQVSKPVRLNITYTANNIEGEQTVVGGIAVKERYSGRFSRWDYDFSVAGNTTFYFYLSNFTTPLTFKMLLVDTPPDLLHYIAAALGAFIVTLVIFFSGVRIQTCLMSRQLQQQRAVEMAVMASRPFATVNLEVSKSAPPDLLAECQNYQLVAAIEPCSDSKAGVMTVFLQLPMPDGDRPPYGQPRLALASTLVQLKHKKSEQRHRERERDHRERERVRENRSAQENQEQSLTQSSQPTTPQLPTLQLQNLAPLAPIPLDDDLPTPILPPVDVMHIRHREAEYDNPAMV